MYVTTFPCHNCAKHILCAGVKKVVYMEPYPKSLAADLHLDGLDIDPSGNGEPGKTALVQYGGVAPRRYHDIFAKEGDRKDAQGRAIRRSKEERASEPRFSSRVRRRDRGELTTGSDPITIEEFKVVSEVSAYMSKANAPSASQPGQQTVAPSSSQPSEAKAVLG